jgi:hypothetical protein
VSIPSRSELKQLSAAPSAQSQQTSANAKCGASLLSQTSISKGTKISLNCLLQVHDTKVFLLVTACATRRTVFPTIREGCCKRARVPAPINQAS